MFDTNHSTRIKVQTNVMPADLTTAEINEMARGIALNYKDGEFICQSFFTPPLVGEINWIEGIMKNAEVHFREIHLIGPNLFHVRLVGTEDAIGKMCRDAKFYRLLQEISSTFNENVRVRRYLETSGRKERWDAIISLDRKAYYLANKVNLKKNTIRIHNIVIIGDRLLGLTGKGEVVIAQLTPDVVEKENVLLEMSLVGPVNKLGKVDLLEPVPNTEDSFLVSIKNHVYQFNIWGDMTHFNALEDEVQQINSISFNNARSIMATSNGLYEVDVQEMPNMVRAISLPRHISNPSLKDNFKTAMYVEDPYVLGIHPAVGVFAKTKEDKVLFF